MIGLAKIQLQVKYSHLSARRPSEASHITQLARHALPFVDMGLTGNALGQPHLLEKHNTMWSTLVHSRYQNPTELCKWHKATKFRRCMGVLAVQLKKQEGSLMLVRERYVSSTSDKPQLNIRMHQEQAVQQSVTKQAASTDFVCGVGTA